MDTVKTVTVDFSPFGFEGDDAVFTAHGAGPNWNGWFVPIVDHETLVAVVARMNERDVERTTELVDLSAGVVVLYEFEWGHEGRELVNESVITPDVDGNYLLDLGLTLVVLDEPCGIENINHQPTPRRPSEY